MKIRKDSAAATKAYYLFLALTGSALTVAAVLNIGRILDGLQWLVGVMSPIIIGFCIAYVLNRPYGFFIRSFERLLKRRGRLPKVLAIIAVYVLAIGFIALIIFYILPSFLESMNELSRSLPGYYENLRAWAGTIFMRFGLDMTYYNEMFLEWTETLSQLAQIIQSYAGQILSYSIQVLGWIGSFTTGFLLSIYILSGKGQLKRQGERLLSGTLSEQALERCRNVFSSANRTFSNYISGRIVDSLIFGVVAFISLQIAGLPYALMLAVTCAVFNFIPVLGPLIGSIITSVIVLITSPGSLFMYIIIVVALQVIDGNIIAPKLIGKMTGLSTLWVLLSITFCGALFGVFGMVFGVPIFGTLFAVVKSYLEYRAAKKADGKDA